MNVKGKDGRTYLIDIPDRCMIHLVAVKEYIPRMGVVVHTNHHEMIIRLQDLDFPVTDVPEKWRKKLPQPVLAVLRIF